MSDEALDDYAIEKIDINRHDGSVETIYVQDGALVETTYGIAWILRKARVAALYPWHRVEFVYYRGRTWDDV